MTDKKIFIFDLDGTLVDAYRAIEKSLNFARKHLGYSLVRYDEVKQKVGKGDVLFIKTFFRSKDVETALAMYRKHHEKSILRYSKPKSYARWLLATLKKKKKLLAIASNRPARFTHAILNRLDMRKYFDYVVCADEINKLKPAPDILRIVLKKFAMKKDQALYIGDMDIDMETAQRAKMDALFVKGGSTHLDGVKKYKNKKIISNLKEVLHFYG